MAQEMLINVSEGEECRIAVVENGRLEELYMERSSATSHVGNIYKGRVTNVEASIQAAFVDFGLGRNGFLHISDLMPTYFAGDWQDVQESVGRKMARRDRPPIQRCLRRGDEIVVQIIKEGIGTKGPTLSTYLSIPGRILVMMPGMTRMGVSRKLEDDEERRRLRQILDSLKPPKEVGFIIRTAGSSSTKVEIQRDFTYLTRVWEEIEKRRNSGPGPMQLYSEGDLITRTVRDVFSADIDRIVVDSDEVAQRVADVIKLTNPRARNKVEVYNGLVPLFHKYGIERDIEMMNSRHVPLPSGGSLVIDSTEAAVAIDVNSGKFRDHSDAETTAFKTDMEAAVEIPRQLRLRDLGGVIICDFIDLRFDRHRRELEKTLHDNFKNDRAKTRVLHMSEFGIIELTRQRMRPSLKRSIYSDCPHCRGAGLVKTPESMSLDVARRLAIAVSDARVVRVRLTVSAEVGDYLQNRKRHAIAALEAQARKRILIHTDVRIGLDEMRLEPLDARDVVVNIPELGAEGVDGPPQRSRPPQAQRGSAPAARPAPPARTRAAQEESEMEDRLDLDRPDPSEPSPDAPAEAVRTQPVAPSAEVIEHPGVEEVGAPAALPALADGPGDQPGDQAKRPRRRGRRGGRGRGRGRREEQRPDPHALPPVTAFETIPQEDLQPVELAPDQEALPPGAPGDGAAGDEQPRRRRRHRGGRRHRRARERAQANHGGQPVPPAPPAVAEPIQPVVPTGSTDRHQFTDDEPVRRSRSYRDLDAIPDDFE